MPIKCKYYYAHEKAYHEDKFQECCLMTKMLQRMGTVGYHALLGYDNKNCLGEKLTCLFIPPRWEYNPRDIPKLEQMSFGGSYRWTCNKCDAVLETWASAKEHLRGETTKWKEEIKGNTRKYRVSLVERLRRNTLKA